MKKSFKKVVAILLAVMMIVCSFPLTALAQEETRTNINLQFGDVSNSATAKHHTSGRGASSATFKKYTGLNSTKLEYSNGKITGYGVGDYFAVSVLVENVSQIAAAETAIKYSDSIVPAYVKTTSSGILVGEYTESDEAHEDSPKLGAFLPQSGNALYNATNTLGETSYVDAETKTMHAQYSVQTGAEYTSATTVNGVADNTFVLATFLFKIVSDGAITFSIDTTEENYYLATTANGGKVEEYKTYAPKSENVKADLDFMGKNEYNGSVANKYTIKFVDADGQEISSTQYEEGADVIAPALPAVTHDDEKHYTYSWDKEVVSPAAADATYTMIKTGAAHKWDDGVVTTAPTTESTGIKTYTCTFDGCGATKTETLDKTECQHEYVWTYNKDAYRDENRVEHDGTETGVCSKCKDTITRTAVGTGSLRVTTYNLTLSAGIAINYKTKTSTVKKFDKVWCQVKKYNASKGAYEDYDPIEDSYIDGTNTGFKFTKISPQAMADNMIVTMCAERDGIVYEGTIPFEIDIRTYVMNQLKKQTTNTSTAVLFVDMLNYGTAAQDYMNYNKNDYINSQLTDTQKSWATPLIANDDYVDSQNSSYVVCENAKVAWRTAALRLESSVDFKMSFSDAAKGTSLTDISNIKVKVQLENGAIQWFNPNDDPECFEPYGTQGRWYFITKDIAVANLVNPIYLTICDENGDPISNTFKYSAESFTRRQVGKAIKNTLDYMQVYAKAAADYNAKNGK